MKKRLFLVLYTSLYVAMVFGQDFKGVIVNACLLYTSYQAQGFHVGPERVVVLWREEGGTDIVTVLFDPCEGLWQQLDASEIVGFLSPVFQPEAALVIQMCIRERCSNKA